MESKWLARLAEQSGESAELDREIKKNLAGLGLELMVSVNEEASA